VHVAKTATQVNALHFRSSQAGHIHAPCLNRLTNLDAILDTLMGYTHPLC